MSWRRLATLMRREVRATLRDRFTVTVLVTVPLAALLTFGWVLSTEVHGLRLAVLDAAQSAASRRLVRDVAATGAFVPTAVVSRAAIEDALVGGAIDVALVIPLDFDRRLDAGERPQVQVLYDGAEALLAGNAEAFLEASIAASGATLARVPRTPSGVRVSVRAAFNPELAGAPFMVSGVFGFVLSFLTTLITAVTIVNERITGTFEQLQVTPATSIEILLGKLLPLGAVFTFDVVLMVVAAGLVLGVWPAGNVIFFVLISSFYVLVSLSLGLLISATSSTAAEAVQKTVLTSIPLVQLSGFAFPVRNMPTPVQWIAEAFPATHYIRLSRAIYLRAEGPVDLAGEIAVLALFAVVLVGVALRRLGARA